jgi:hypothetical protein
MQNGHVNSIFCKKILLALHFYLASHAPGFENYEFPNHVFKLTKTLYGLKQTPRAWYERLSGFLIEKGFTQGKLDTTLFLMFYGKDMLIVQIYVNDIIFGATNENLCKEFFKTM